MRLIRRALFVVGVIVVAAGCGGEDQPALQGPPEAGGNAVTVIGESLRFDVTELRVDAGEELVITFENEDAGVPHNFHVDGGEAGQFTTPIEDGPTTQELRVRIDSPGRYDYVCDVHRDTMRGTLVVS